MERQKMHPGLLRLFVIFPNILSYFLLFGIIIFTVTNYAQLQANGAHLLWLGLIAILTPASLFTTYRIAQKLKNGAM